MNEMNSKKLYLWKRAAFLHEHGMSMSGEELAAHLNRNGFLTIYGTQYEGTRGTYTLIRETWNWVNTLGLPKEAEKIAHAFVKPDGTLAWD
jgi:hypothetical protein